MLAQWSELTKYAAEKINLYTLFLIHLIIR
jgi:hypothetical protein